MIPGSADHNDASLHDWLVRQDEVIAMHPATEECSVSDDRADDNRVHGDAELHHRLQRLTECLRLLEFDRQRVNSSARKPDRLSANTPMIGGSTIQATFDKSDPPAISDGSADLATDVPRRIGRFQIVRRLGSGGFGMVFLATDPRLLRMVAIKVPRPETLFSNGLRQRFLEESRVAAKLDHPHIVPVHEAGESNGCLYQVSAYCSGPSLRDWMRNTKQSGQLNSDQLIAGTNACDKIAAEIVECLSRAIAYCHLNGVLHRDLKPANVMLAEQPCGNLPFTPRLTDFGLAKLMDQDLAVSGSGAMIGTPLYMSPEQARGDRMALGPGTDIYSLGAILYELLTGRTPFSGGLSDVLDQLRRVEPVPPIRIRPEISRVLNAVCLKCLKKNPAERYSSAAELADELYQIQSDLSVRRVASRMNWKHVQWLALPVIVLVATVPVWNRHQTTNPARQTTVSLSDESGPGRLFKHGGDIISAPIQFDGSVPLTVETWIQIHSPGGIAIELGGMIALQFSFMEQQCRPSVTVNLSESENAIFYSDSTINTETWHHVAVVLKDHRVSLFLNGNELPTDVFMTADNGESVLMDPAPSIPLKPIWPDLGLTIGSNNIGSSIEKRYPFAGRIRAVRISRSARYQNAFSPSSHLMHDGDTLALFDLNDSTVDRFPDASGQHMTPE